ncbi:hypothetical protein Tco_1017412 [Tanacetum coccineum]|uniref:Uncharacterized protein n=1 Tax=Tanacetum coccineum TaxID=301880 RepID=A0ABQ5FTZ5_9ASTR
MHAINHEYKYFPTILGSLSQDVYGYVFSDNASVVSNELKDTYDRVDGSIVFNLLQKINWEYILPEVNDAFYIVAKEESHKGIPPTSMKNDKPRASALFFRTNDNRKNNNDFYANLNINGVNYHFRWIIDSDANQHITNSSKDMFDLVIISELKLIVGHPNETLAKITHVVNLKLNNDVVLFDVLVVLDYCFSLLSIHKLIKDIKLGVGFDETKCYIQDFKRKKVLGIGSEFSGLYVFDKEYNKYVANNNILSGKSPFSLVYGKEPNVSHLRSFGCFCFAVVVKGIDKFSSSSRCTMPSLPELDAITNQPRHDGVIGKQNQSEGNADPSKEVPLFQNSLLNETGEVGPRRSKAF